MSRSTRTLAAVCTTLALSAPARADVVQAARADYDHGKRAYDDGAYADAARDFARADQLAPNAAVLELALTAAMRAEDPTLGMELVDRARLRGLTQLVEAGQRAFAAQAGRVVLRCPEAVVCEATLDGDPLKAGAARWFRVGDHYAVLHADGVEERLTLHVEGDQTAELRPTHVLRVRVPELAPLAPLPQRTEQPAGTPGRVHPAWFFGALGLTVAAGAATTLSGLDTLSLHDQFEREPTNSELAAEGNRAQVRTNVLAVSTAVLAVTTGVIGYLVLKTRHD